VILWLVEALIEGNQVAWWCNR